MAEEIRNELAAALNPVLHANRRTIAISEMVMGYGSVNMGEGAAAAKGAMYADAVGDMPAWAVREAIRRWNRRQCGEQNYNFAPSPPVLRTIAEAIIQPYQDKLAQLDGVLNAATGIDDVLDSRKAEQPQTLVPRLRAMS